MAWGVGWGGGATIPPGCVVCKCILYTCLQLIMKSVIKISYYNSVFGSSSRVDSF